MSENKGGSLVKVISGLELELDECRCIGIWYWKCVIYISG